MIKSGVGVIWMDELGMLHPKIRLNIPGWEEQLP